MEHPEDYLYPDELDVYYQLEPEMEEAWFFVERLIESRIASGEGPILDLEDYGDLED